MRLIDGVVSLKHNANINPTSSLNLQANILRINFSVISRDSYHIFLTRCFSPSLALNCPSSDPVCLLSPVLQVDGVTSKVLLLATRRIQSPPREYLVHFSDPAQPCSNLWPASPSFLFSPLLPFDPPLLRLSRRRNFRTCSSIHFFVLSLLVMSQLKTQLQNSKESWGEKGSSQVQWWTNIIKLMPQWQFCFNTIISSNLHLTLFFATLIMFWRGTTNKHVSTSFSWM